MSKLWTPKSPAIIRSSDEMLENLRKGAQREKAIIPGTTPIVSSETPPTITYRGEQSGSGGDSASFSNVAIGTARNDRLVVAVLQKSNGVTTTNSSCTIGGIAGTQAIGTNANNLCQIWYAVVPSGTTATVSWVGTGGSDGYTCAVYTITGYNSATPVYTSATAPDNVSDSVTTSALPGGSAVIAGRVGGVTSTSTTASSGVTQDYARVQGGLSNSWGGSRSDASGSITISHTYGNNQGGANCPRMCIAAWR